MRELVLLRHNFSKETKNMEDNENILNIPTKSTQELIDLEDKIRKDPHSEKCLVILSFIKLLVYVCMCLISFPNPTENHI